MKPIFPNCLLVLVLLLHNLNFPLLKPSQWTLILAHLSPTQEFRNFFTLRHLLKTSQTVFQLAPVSFAMPFLKLTTSSLQNVKNSLPLTHPLFHLSLISYIFPDPNIPHQSRPYIFCWLLTGLNDVMLLKLSMFLFASTRYLVHYPSPFLNFQLVANWYLPRNATSRGLSSSTRFDSLKKVSLNAQVSTSIKLILLS